MKNIQIDMRATAAQGMSTTSQVIAQCLRMHGIHVEINDLDDAAGGQEQFSTVQLMQRMTQLRDAGLKVVINQHQLRRANANPVVELGDVMQAAATGAVFE